MLYTNAIAAVDAPGGEDDSAVKSGVDDLVAIGGDVDAIVTLVGVEGVDDGAVERHKEILHQRAGLGGRQVVVAKEVVLVLCLIFGAQQTVLHRFLQRDGVGDALGQRFVDIGNGQGAVVSEVVAFHDAFQVLKVDIPLLHLTADGIGAEVELVHLAVEVGVGVSRDVFAQRREGDDEGRDDDEQQSDAKDDPDEVEQVKPELEHGVARLIVRHHEVVLAVEFLVRQPSAQPCHRDLSIFVVFGHYGRLIGY